MLVSPHPTFSLTLKLCMSKNCPPSHLCLLLAASKLSFQEDAITITSECCSIVFSFVLHKIWILLFVHLPKSSEVKLIYLFFCESVSFLKQCVLPPNVSPIPVRACMCLFHREVAHETYPLFFFHLPQCSGLSCKEKLWLAFSGK